MSISETDIFEACALTVDGQVSFDYMGLVDSPHPNTLTFLDRKEFLDQIYVNENISGIVTTPEVSAGITRSDLIVITSDDPRLSFFKLYNWIAARDYRRKPTQIDSTAKIHPTAVIEEYNVVIGPNADIGSHVTIMEGTELGRNCVVQAGCVLGVPDVDTKPMGDDYLMVTQDGRLIVGDDVHIGASSTICRGYSYRDTVIGRATKISARTFMGHCATVGERCLLLECYIHGSAVIGSGSRVSPNAVVSSQVVVGKNAYITIGSVVVRDVPDNGRVTGNFATDHRKFLYGQARLYSRRSSKKKS